MPVFATPAAPPTRAILWVLGIAGIWFVVALLSSFQGYMSGIAHGNHQPWLPAFATSLIWFGCWAVVTPIAVTMARKFGPSGRSWALFVTLQLVGAVATA